MRRLAMSLVAAASVAVLGCQTITEEMPTRPDPIQVGGTQGPVVVVPVPIPSPTTRPPQEPTPVPGPGGPGGPGIPPNVPNNNSPVARVGAKVYFVECNGVEVPGSEYATTAPVGCRIHMDCTPRDANNAPTQARGTPEWTYSDTSIISIGGRSPYNPVLLARAPGNLSMYVTIDGVRSSDVRIRIQ